MILSRHGHERAACVAMIDTYRARAAIREVGKALGLPEVEVGVVAKAFPHISARHLREGLERLPELQGHQPADAPARSAVPGGRTARRLPPAHRAASLRDRAGQPRPGAACAPRTLRERAPHGPGRQGRRRAARLPEARHPRRADALVDAARAGRDRAHHRREGRPRTDPARRSGHVRADPRLRHARLLPDRIAGPARAAPEAPARRVRGSDRRHLAVPARPGQVGHDPPVHRAADGAATAHLHPSGAPAGVAGDVRGDRLPRTGDADARRARRLRPDVRRPRPAAPRRRGDAAGVARGLPHEGGRARGRSGRRRAPRGTRWRSSRRSGSARRTRPRSRCRRTARRGSRPTIRRTSWPACSPTTPACIRGGCSWTTPDATACRSCPWT